MEYKKGSETEVTCDFVFRCEASLWESPQATIGLQRSTLPDAKGHCCTALFVFCGSDLTYVTAPFYHYKIGDSRRDTVCLNFNQRGCSANIAGVITRQLRISLTKIRSRSSTVF